MSGNKIQRRSRSDADGKWKETCAGSIKGIKRPGDFTMPEEAWTRDSKHDSDIKTLETDSAQEDLEASSLGSESKTEFKISKYKRSDNGKPLSKHSKVFEK